MKISVIVPCYNEEKVVKLTLPHLHQVLSSLEMPLEIIAVSDGSTDDTVNALNQLALDSVKIIELKKNRGKGAALKEGVRYASGEIVFFHDADLLLPPELFRQALKKLESNEAIFASKNLPQSNFPRPFRRRFFSRLFNLFARLFLGLSFSDVLTGFKAFQRKAIEDMLDQVETQRFQTDLEICWLAQQKGYRSVEVPMVGRSIRRPSRFVSSNDFSGVLGVFWWILKKRGQAGKKSKTPI